MTRSTAAQAYGSAQHLLFKIPRQSQEHLHTSNTATDFWKFSQNFITQTTNLIIVSKKALPRKIRKHKKITLQTLEQTATLPLTATLKEVQSEHVLE